jgi:gas vesicle protein
MTPMSLIVSEVYDALIEAGTTVEKARAAAAAIPVAERLVTREELTDQTGMLKEDLGQVKSELKQDINDVRSDLKQDIGDVRSELKQDLSDVRSDLKQDIFDVKQDIARLDKRIAVLNLAVFSFGPAILALLVKLTFFP